MLGITSMFIASKYEEVVPIYMNTMTIRVAHNLLTPKEIMSAEREICNTLHWKFSGVPTSLDYLELYLQDPFFKGHQQLAFISEMSTFLALLCLHHI